MRFASLLASFLLLAMCVVTLVIPVQQTKRTAPRPRPETMTASETEPPQPRRVRLSMPPVFETESFYRTIIENNLFRPLGWTPSRPTEPYRLIGTILPRSEETPAKAILESTAGETSSTFEVSAGDRLDDETVVISIEGKSVVLETSGKRRTLHLPSGF